VGRFVESTSGNVAMIFGLVIVVLVMICGAGIDVARAVSMRSRLASSLDAAGLAIGAEINLTSAQLEQMATDYFNANYPDAALGTTYQITVTPIGDEEFELSASGKVETVFLRVVNINEFNVSVNNRVTRAGKDLEVALVLDVTNSMSGQPITDLKVAAKDMVDIIVQPVQTPFYSKMAIVPYSMAVNVGNTYASSVRGAITPGSMVTAAAWTTGASKVMTGVTRANPAVVTSAAHGLVTGDKVWISGVVGMTQLNNKPFIVGTTTANTFQLRNLNNTNHDSSTYTAYSSAGLIRKCVTPALNTSCQVQVTTSGAHGFANGDWVVIQGVGGMTQINSATNTAWQVSQATGTTFVLTGTMPSGTNPAYPAYTSGGTAYCTVQACQYLRFTNANNSIKVFPISTCVSERPGANAYTDAAPSTTPLGRVYPAASPMASTVNPCLTPTITPLSDDITYLKGQVDALQAGGSTGGHIGIAWGWYMLSPNFGYLFPQVSKPKPYQSAFLWKVMILMTDGEYNSSYCNSVISQDSTSGSGSANDHINCNAPNGHAYVQSDALCDAIKAQGIMVYTVGFNVNSSANAQNLVANCATSPQNAYYPNSGAELKDSFVKIAQDITELRLSR
jgi:Flp pilus assembly protein TadG